MLFHWIFKIMFPTMAMAGFSRVASGKDKTKLNKTHFCYPAASLCFFEVDVAALFVVSCRLLCVILMCLLCDMLALWIWLNWRARFCPRSQTCELSARFRLCFALVRCRQCCTSCACLWVHPAWPWSSVRTWTGLLTRTSTRPPGSLLALARTSQMAWLHCVTTWPSKWCRCLGQIVGVRQMEVPLEPRLTTALWTRAWPTPPPGESVRILLTSPMPSLMTTGQPDSWPCFRTACPRSTDWATCQERRSLTLEVGHPLQMAWDMWRTNAQIKATLPTTPSLWVMAMMQPWQCCATVKGMHSLSMRMRRRRTSVRPPTSSKLGTATFGLALGPSMRMCKRGNSAMLRMARRWLWPRRAPACQPRLTRAFLPSCRQRPTMTSASFMDLQTAATATASFRTMQACRIIITRRQMSWLRIVILGTANAQSPIWTVLQVRTWAGSLACLPLLPCWCTAEAELTACCLPWPGCCQGRRIQDVGQSSFRRYFWLLTLWFKVLRF